MHAMCTDPVIAEAPKERAVHVHAMMDDLHRQRVVVLNERNSDRHQVFATNIDIVGHHQVFLELIVLSLHQSNTRILEETLENMVAALLVIIRVFEEVFEDELVCAQCL